jgi:hypothetical protein
MPNTANVDDWVTRENGEKVCQLAYPLGNGAEWMQLDHFKNWQIEPPPYGTIVPTYKADGQAWIRLSSTGAQVFVNGRWAP